MAQADSEDRTLAATERRLQRAREEGQVPLSREVVVAAGLGALTLTMALGGPALAGHLTGRLHRMLGRLDVGPGAALWDAGLAFLAASLPVAAAVLCAGSLAVLLQTGWLVRGKALLPDVARLDPRRGLKRLIGPENGIETLKSLVKLGVLAWAAWSAMQALLPGIGAAASWTTQALLDRLFRETAHLLLVVCACQAGIAVLDAGWVRFRFHRQLRMSPDEVKQEQKESDGDPRLKAKLRQLRLARAKRRMMAAVPKATVVITNPTHYAVALAYDRGVQAAPKVVAKGVDEVAARIREVATANGVPLVANPPLARALHQVALDAEVPAEHFKAVAEIIAYVWRLRGQVRRAGMGG